MNHKKQYINDYYRNSTNKKGYCIHISEKFMEYGFGEVLWTSIQTNWFSKGNLPRERYKLNRLYDITKEFARDQAMRAEEEEKPSTMDAG